MRILSQNDPEWANVGLPPSNIPIKKIGCTSVAICMLSDWFGCYVRPDEFVKNNVRYTPQGLIIWEALNLPCMGFNRRVRRYSESDVTESLNGANTACILAINNDSHWVTALKEVNDSYYVADPWDGKKKFIPKSIVSGSAHFTRKAGIPAEPSNELDPRNLPFDEVLEAYKYLKSAQDKLLALLEDHGPKK